MTVAIVSGSPTVAPLPPLTLAAVTVIVELTVAGGGGGGLLLPEPPLHPTWLIASTITSIAAPINRLRRLIGHAINIRPSIISAPKNGSRVELRVIVSEATRIRSAEAKRMFEAAIAGCAATVAFAVNVTDAPAASAIGGAKVKVLSVSGGDAPAVAAWPLALSASAEKTPGSLSATVTELSVSAAPVALRALKVALTCWPGLALIVAPGALKPVPGGAGVGVAVGIGVDVGVGVGSGVGVAVGVGVGVGGVTCTITLKLVDAFDGLYWPEPPKLAVSGISPVPVGVASQEALPFALVVAEQVAPPRLNVIG